MVLRQQRHHMSVVRTSTRAFMGVALLLALFHGVMLVLGLATFLADQMEAPSPDRAFQILAAQVGADALLLMVGHSLLRSFGLGSRAAYGLMGGAACAIGYSIALSRNLLIAPPLDGARLTASVLPILVGMIAAVMYVRLAGREVRQPDREATADIEGASTAAPVTFDGPVQVRTSFAGVAVASAMPAAIIALITIPFVTTIFGHFRADAPRSLDWGKQINEMAFPAYFFMVALLTTSLPSAIIIVATHGIARSTRRVGGSNYACIGAAVAAAGAVLASSFISLWLTLPLAAMAGGVMGLVYRWFAGIEPLALPEAVLATDRATLVGEHDPSRRTRAVIMNG
jgi:hypothetical protein